MIQALMGNKIITVRPSKRKVIKTVSTMEQVAKTAQKDLPADYKSLAKNIAESLNNLKHRLANGGN